MDWLNCDKKSISIEKNTTLMPFPQKRGQLSYAWQLQKWIGDT